MLDRAVRRSPSSCMRPASASATAPNRIAIFGRLAAYIMRSPLSIASRGSPPFAHVHQRQRQPAALDVGVQAKITHRFLANAAARDRWRRAP